VIRVFLSEASFLRLATALATNRNDTWTNRRYVVPASPTLNVHNVTRRGTA
jgi:hypothetical protein